MPAATCGSFASTGPTASQSRSDAEDLTRINAILRAADGRQLLVGASSIAEIFVQEPRPAPPPERRPAPAQAGVFLLAGSRSATTAAQIEAAEAWRKLALTPEAAADGSLVSQAADLLAAHCPVLVHLLPDRDYGVVPGALADISARFVTNVLERVDIGYLGLAGGDTSSRVCAALGFTALEHDADLDPGVCVCRMHHTSSRRNGLRVMLKGGQMGQTDLFDRFAAFAKGV